MVLPSTHTHSTDQSGFFREDSILFYGKAGTPLIGISNIINKGRTNHMPKFKQFY